LFGRAELLEAEQIVVKTSYPFHFTGAFSSTATSAGYSGRLWVYANRPSCDTEKLPLNKAGRGTRRRGPAPVLMLSIERDEADFRVAPGHRIGK